MSAEYLARKTGLCLSGLFSWQPHYQPLPSHSQRGRFPDKLRKCCNCKFQYILVCRCLADSPYADVCFLVHGVPMPAHRVILTARSSYFAHMFMSKWRDRPLIELKHKLVRPSETLIVLEHLISVVSLFEYLFLFTYFTVTGWRPVYMSGMGYWLSWNSYSRACNAVLLNFTLVRFNLRLDGVLTGSSGYE